MEVVTLDWHANESFELACLSTRSKIPVDMLQIAPIPDLRTQLDEQGTVYKLIC